MKKILLSFSIFFTSLAMAQSVSLYGFKIGHLLDFPACDKGISSENVCILASGESRLSYNGEKFINVLILFPESKKPSTWYERSVDAITDQEGRLEFFTIHTLGDKNSQMQTFLLITDQYGEFIQDGGTTRSAMGAIAAGSLFAIWETPDKTHISLIGRFDGKDYGAIRVFSESAYFAFQSQE